MNRKSTSNRKISNTTATSKAKKSTNTTKRKKPKYDKNTLDWINTEGGDKKFRKRVVSVNKKHGVDLVVLEPGVFDYGVKRLGDKKDGYVVVYDAMKLAEALAEDYLKWNESRDNKNRIEGYDFDAAHMDAVEWISYNTARSLPYMGEYAPKLVTEDEDGNEIPY